LPIRSVVLKTKSTVVDAPTHTRKVAERSRSDLEQED